MRQVALVLGPIVVAGCSLMTSLDGYTGGATPSDGGGSTDARVDGEAGPGPTDAGSDGTTGKDFCASLAKPPKFCADFSDGLLVGNDGSKNFDDERHTGTAPLAALDNAIFGTSAPAARFALPASAQSYLSRSFPGVSPVPMEFGMAMRMDASGAGADLMEIRVGSATSFTASVFLTRETSGGLHVTEAYDLPDGGAGVQSWPLSRTMPAGTWTRFVWKVDSSGVLVLTVDGVVALQQQLIDPPVATPGIAALAGCTGTSQDATLWVDDVYVDY